MPTPALVTQPDRSGKSVLSLDSETELIMPGNLTPDMVCVSYATDEEHGLAHHSDPDLFDFLHTYLMDHKTILIGANICYDLAVWIQWDPRLLGPVFIALDEDRVEDVQTRQKLIDTAHGRLGGEHKRVDGHRQWVEYRYNLAALEVRYGMPDRSEDKGEGSWRLRYGELIDVPLEDWPAKPQEYAIADATGALQVYRGQEPHAHLLQDAFRQQRAHWALHLMSCVGVHTDPVAVDLYEKWTHRKLDKDRAELIESGLVVPKKSPTKAQKEKGVPGPWFSRKMKLAKERMLKIHPECKLTDGGKSGNQQPSLDADAVKEAGDLLLIKFQEFGSTSKILTNIEDLRKGIEHPIQTRYELLLKTGRTASQYPNMQNRRKQFGDRECVIARPGMVFWQADYSGLELHTFSQICLWAFGYSKMADALNAGLDVHLVMAASILGIPYKDCKRRYKAGDKVVETARMLAKIANFGFGGGLGAVALVVQARAKYMTIICDITEHEPYGVCRACVRRAKKLRVEWKETWDEGEEYLGKYINDLTRSGAGFLEQPYSLRRRGGASYTEASNHFFQALGADAAKQAAWELTVACYADKSSILYGDRPSLFVHDEFIGETPDTPEAHDHAMEVENVICSAANKWVPDVPVTAPPLLMKRWSKKAKAEYDQNKRLTPWDCDLYEGFSFDPPDDGPEAFAPIVDNSEAHAALASFYR